MEDSPRITRRFSHSTVSETTISSSVVSTRKNSTPNHGIGKNLQDLSGSTQNNVKIESSSGIRVGDVIYNIYSPSPPSESELN